jgi:hypothetical protein
VRTRVMKAVGFLAVLAAVAAVAGVAAPSAMSSDCDTGAYWNVLSRYLGSGVGQSCNTFGPSTGETEVSTFGGGYSTIRGFCSDHNGTWTQSVLLQYNVAWRFFSCEFVGVYNNHPDLIWVNAHHNDS